MFNVKLTCYLLSRYALNPSLNELSMMLIPNSPAAGVAFMWIKDYLKMAGLFHFDLSSYL